MSGYRLKGTRIIKQDNNGGDYRIFLARDLDDGTEKKVVATIPGGDIFRPLHMALKPDRDKAGRLQYIGRLEAAPDPQPAVSVPRNGSGSTRGVSDDDPQKKTEPQFTPSSRDPDRNLIDKGYVRIRVEKVFHRKPQLIPPLPGDTVPYRFCIMSATVIGTGERMRIYADVPGAEAAPGDEFLFLLKSKKRGQVAIEYRGLLAIPSATAPVAQRENRPPSQIPSRGLTQRPATSSVRTKTVGSQPDMESEGSKTTEIRLRGIGKPIHFMDYKRLDGTIDYFRIFNAIIVGTQKKIKVKAFLPQPDINREMTLHLELSRDAYGEVYTQGSEPIPERYRGVDFSLGEWVRKRVTGTKLVTPEREDPEARQIFEVVDEESGAVFKLRGEVPGGNPICKMSAMVRACKWRKGELEYEGEMLEPDPNVTAEEMAVLVKKLRVPGLTERLTRNVVDLFGPETLAVIRYAPERLLEVEGVNIGTVEQIRKAQHLDLSGAILSEMGRSGVNARYFKGILNHFKDMSVEVIRDRPYDLIQVNGISFAYADEVAVKKKGLSDLSPDRVRAALSSVVKKLISSGKSAERIHTVIGKVKNETSRVGNSDWPRFERMLRDHIAAENGREEGLVRYRPDSDGRMIEIREVIEAERRTAINLRLRLMIGPGWTPFDPSTLIERYEAEKGRRLGAEQREAVRMTCLHGTGVMTGGPGVGKTTTLDATVKALHAAGVHTVLMAPTGIAAKRMTESTGLDALTVHSAIGQLEREDPDDPFLPLDMPVCAIIDETSMVNVFVLDKLLRVLPDRVSILFIGDVDQLASIGPGEILRDLIRSEIFPVARLTEVFRTGDKSGIIEAARAINAEVFPAEAEDFRIIPIREAEEIREQVRREVIALQGLKNFNPVRDLMVLSPVKKGEAGVVALNEMLQELLNPAGPNRPEIFVSRPLEVATDENGPIDEAPIIEDEGVSPKRAIPKPKSYRETLRLGDRVIQTRNDKDRGLVNGDIGIITGVEPHIQMITVAFDGGEYQIDQEQLKDIRLAYSMTVHKSQGSEADHVIIPLPLEYMNMLIRNLLYTAVTRGKKAVTVIGCEEAILTCLAQTVDKSDNLMRHTTLDRHCRDPELEAEVLEGLELGDEFLEALAGEDEDWEADPC